MVAVEFVHGVASGDPWSSSIVLWTRVSPQLSPLHDLRNLTIGWTVFDAAGLAARSGEVLTTSAADWTIKTTAVGLRDGIDYTYRFHHGGVASPTGRFRLPPPRTADLASLRYGIFSCSSWAWGHFNSFAVAAASRLDFWMHVGDYFYEYGQEGHYPAAHIQKEISMLLPGDAPSPELTHT